MGNTLEAFTGETNEEAAAKSQDPRHGWRPATAHQSGADLRFRGKLRPESLEPAALTTAPVDGWTVEQKPLLLPAQENDEKARKRNVFHEDSGAVVEFEESDNTYSSDHGNSSSLLTDPDGSKTSQLSDITDWNFNVKGDKSQNRYFEASVDDLDVGTSFLASHEVEPISSSLPGLVSHTTYSNAKSTTELNSADRVDEIIDQEIDEINVEGVGKGEEYALLHVNHPVSEDVSHSHHTSLNDICKDQPVPSLHCDSNALQSNVNIPSKQLEESSSTPALSICDNHENTINLHENAIADALADSQGSNDPSKLCQVEFEVPFQDSSTDLYENDPDHSLISETDPENCELEFSSFERDSDDGGDAVELVKDIVYWTDVIESISFAGGRKSLEVHDLIDPSNEREQLFDSQRAETKTNEQVENDTLLENGHEVHTDFGKALQVEPKSCADAAIDCSPMPMEDGPKISESSEALIVDNLVFPNQSGHVIDEDHMNLDTNGIENLDKENDSVSSGGSNDHDDFTEGHLCALAGEDSKEEIIIANCDFDLVDRASPWSDPEDRLDPENSTGPDSFDFLNNDADENVIVDTNNPYSVLDELCPEEGQSSSLAISAGICNEEGGGLSDDVQESWSMAPEEDEIESPMFDEVPSFNEVSDNIISQSACDQQKESTATNWLEDDLQTVETAVENFELNHQTVERIVLKSEFDLVKDDFVMHAEPVDLAEPRIDHANGELETKAESDEGGREGEDEGRRDNLVLCSNMDSEPCSAYLSAQIRFVSDKATNADSGVDHELFNVVHTAYLTLKETSSIAGAVNFKDVLKPTVPIKVCDASDFAECAGQVLVEQPLSDEKESVGYFGFSIYSSAGPPCQKFQECVGEELDKSSMEMDSIQEDASDDIHEDLSMAHNKLAQHTIAVSEDQSLSYVDGERDFSTSVEDDMQPDKNPSFYETGNPLSPIFTEASLNNLREEMGMESNRQPTIYATASIECDSIPLRGDFNVEVNHRDGEDSFPCQRSSPSHEFYQNTNVFPVHCHGIQFPNHDWTDQPMNETPLCAEAFDENAVIQTPLDSFHVHLSKSSEIVMSQPDYSPLASQTDPTEIGEWLEPPTKSHQDNVQETSGVNLSNSEGFDLWPNSEGFVLSPLNQLNDGIQQQTYHLVSSVADLHLSSYGHDFQTQGFSSCGVDPPSVPGPKPFVSTYHPEISETEVQIREIHSDQPRQPTYSYEEVPHQPTHSHEEMQPQQPTHSCEDVQHQLHQPSHSHEEAQHQPCQPTYSYDDMQYQLSQPTHSYEEVQLHLYQPTVSHEEAQTQLHQPAHSHEVQNYLQQPTVSHEEAQTQLNLHQLVHSHEEVQHHLHQPTVLHEEAQTQLRQPMHSHEGQHQLLQPTYSFDEVEHQPTYSYEEVQHSLEDDSEASKIESLELRQALTSAEMDTESHSCANDPIQHQSYTNDPFQLPRIGPEGKNTSHDPSPAPSGNWEEEEDQQEEFKAENEVYSRTGDSLDAEVGAYLVVETHSPRSWKSTNDLDYDQAEKNPQRRRRRSRKDELRKSDRKLDGKSEEDARNVSLRRHVLRKAASSCLTNFPDDVSPIRHPGVGQSRAGDDPDREGNRGNRRRSRRSEGRDKKKEEKRAENKSGRRRKSSGRARELEEYVSYCESYYRAYYPDWYMQYFSQYEDYLRQSYLSQYEEAPASYYCNNDDEAPASYHCNNPEAWSGVYLPTPYNQPGLPNTAVPYYPSALPQPYAVDQYDAGYGWSNWFQAFQPAQPSIPLKYSAPLPCLKFSGNGMVQLSASNKRTTVSIMTISSRLTGRAELVAFPSPLSQTKPPKKQLLSFCRSQLQRLGLKRAAETRLSKNSVSSRSRVIGDCGRVIEGKEKRERRRRRSALSLGEPDEGDGGEQSMGAVGDQSGRSEGKSGRRRKNDGDSLSNSNLSLSLDTSHRSLNSIADRELRGSADEVDQGLRLLWELMELLLRQNGKIVGIDVADLLLDDEEEFIHGSVSSGLNSTQSDGEFDEPLDPSAILTHFRKLMERGKMTEAIDWAFANKKEGHGLYLTMMLDSVVPGSNVLSALQRLERELAPEDSLLTLYYLLTERQPPISVKAVGSSNWRQHVAIAVANLSDDPQYHSTLKRFLTSLGDSLNSSGLLCASHFCQLLIIWCTSSLPLVSIAVIGLSRSHHHRSRDSSSTASLSSSSNWNPPSNDLIQLTELHEYLMAQFEPILLNGSAITIAAGEAFSVSGSDLGALPASLTMHRNFSAYKLIYAQRLLEAGLPKQALSCCVELSKSVRFENFPRVLAAQIKSVAMRALLEDRAFYSSFVIRRNSFSDALPTWLLELEGAAQSTPSQ